MVCTDIDMSSGNSSTFPRSHLNFSQKISILLCLAIDLGGIKIEMPTIVTLQKVKGISFEEVSPLGENRLKKGSTTYVLNPIPSLFSE